MNRERQHRKHGDRPRGWVHPYLLAVEAYEATSLEVRPAFLKQLERREDRAFVRMVLYAAQERAIQRQGKYRRRD